MNQLSTSELELMLYALELIEKNDPAQGMERARQFAGYIPPALAPNFLEHVERAFAGEAKTYRIRKLQSMVLKAKIAQELMLRGGEDLEAISAGIPKEEM